MKVLGIDPGHKRLGFALTESNAKNEIALRESGVIYHENDNQLTFNAYLNEGIANLCEQFPQVLHRTKPDFIVAEIIPVGRLGSNTELNVAAITVCKVIAWQWGIDWFEIAANSVKKIYLTPSTNRDCACHADHAGLCHLGCQCQVVY